MNWSRLPVAEARSRLWLYPASCVLVAVVLAIRRPDSILHPQLWAEDGPIFLQQQIELGWRSIFTPYAGYLHLVPRLIAWISGELVPLQYVPLAYNMLTLVVSSAALSRLSISTLPSGMPWLLTAAAVVVPHGGEIFVNVTNVQWLLALPLLVIIMEDRNGRACRIWVDSLVVLVMGLTGPFSLLFLPVLALRLIIDRGFQPSLPVTLALLITASVQGLVLLTGGGQHAPGYVQVGLYQFLHWFCRDLMLPYFGVVTRDTVPLALGLPAFVSSFVVLMSPALAKRTLAGLLLCFLFGALLIPVAMALKLGGLVLPGVGPFAGGQRYTYISYVMFTWCLIVVIVRPRQAYFRWLASCALALTVGASLLRFTAPALPDLKWRELVSSPRAVKSDIPINPTGWKVTLPPNL